MNHLFNVVFGLVCLYGLYWIGDYIYFMIKEKIEIAQAPKKQAEYNRKLAEYEAALKIRQAQHDKEQKEERERKKKENDTV